GASADSVLGGSDAEVVGNLVAVVVRVHAPGEHQLFAVVKAHDALGLLFGAAEGRQEHRGENRDDGDDDQQFDQRECLVVVAGCFRGFGGTLKQFFRRHKCNPLDKNTTVNVM